MTGIWAYVIQVGYFHVRSTLAFPVLPGAVVCAECFSKVSKCFMIILVFTYSGSHWSCVYDVGNWYKDSGDIISEFKAYNFHLLIGCP